MTIYDFICQQWPNHAQRIIEATLAAGGRLTDDVGELTVGIQDANMLACLFVWEYTPEGHEYWSTLAQQGEATPKVLT